MAKMKKVRGTGQKAQNATYKASGQRDKNKLVKLARANALHPNDIQTAQAYVDLYHKLHG